MSYIDRTDAGRRLSGRLHHLRCENCVVVGLPRGGVPVAAEVARALDSPLDVIIVRKLGVPYQPEVAMGAIGEQGVVVIDTDMVSLARVPPADLAAVQRAEGAELQRRVEQFRGDRQRMSLAGKTVVIVDDGVATGSTARAACQVVKALGAKRVVLAVPVAPAAFAAKIATEVDEYVCADEHESLGAVGQYYADFTPTTDREVLECLRTSAMRALASDAGLMDGNRARSGSIASTARRLQ